MQIPQDIFRTYDIRGLLEQVTPDIARQVGKILVHLTGAKTVVVGRDMRATSPELLRAACEGMVAMGADVIDIGMCTTPLFSFTVRHLRADAGLMVTASHNPPEWNGIKFADASGLPISGRTFLADMEKEFPPAPMAGSVREESALDAYVDACLHWPGTPECKGTKVVVDYGNGMGALTMRPLAQRLGIELVELYPEPDARFPNHEANPAKEETLADLKKEVVARGADFGIALDGDADRIAFIDNEGQSIRGDLTLVLFAQDALRRHPGGKIVVSPNQSWTTFDAIQKAGGELVDCAIGRTLMIHKMSETGALVSGEVSSHFFFSEFGNLEAPEHAFVRMLGIWKASGATFADFVRPLREYENSTEINFRVPDKEALLQGIKNTYASQASFVNLLDGIRCDFNRDWWFIARASNNEPLIRLIIEAKDAALLHNRITELSRFMESMGGENILGH